MKILLVDDHAIVRAGLRQLLSLGTPVTVAEAASGREALATVARERPDVLVLDLNLPDVGGVELIRRLLLQDASLRILVLSMHAEPLYASRALQAGARGYISKSAEPQELLSALRRVAEGGRYIEAEIAQALALQNTTSEDPLQGLSERNLEILRLLAGGRSLAEIAASLGVGYKTVANACTQIKATLGVARTADLVRLAIAMGVS
ncbi:MAG: response regulator transcription factor [Alphaproteobacteria bacterium]|nr:response regulator transcription factor [Alphaproteobacteria bacterium]